MRDQLQKALRLIEKTGDRIIMFDSADARQGYALMSLDEYERLALGNADVRGLTEDQLLDRINRDIAQWRSDQIGSPIALDDDEAADPTGRSRAGGEERRKRWEIPPERKEGAAEVEEERQYIEPIMF